MVGRGEEILMSGNKESIRNTKVEKSRKGDLAGRRWGIRGIRSSPLKFLKNETRWLSLEMSEIAFPKTLISKFPKEDAPGPTPPLTLQRNGFRGPYLEALSLTSYIRPRNKGTIHWIHSVAHFSTQFYSIFFVGETFTPRTFSTDKCSVWLLTRATE